MILILVVMLSGLAAFGYWTIKSWGMDEEELRRRVGAARGSVGIQGAAARAPVAWLGVAVLSVLDVVLVWLLDWSDSRLLLAMAAVGFGGWVIATALAISASVAGRPRRLVHPRLRDDGLAE